MSTSMRILLLVAPVLVAAYTLRRIRKSKMQIEDSLYWIAFCAITVVLGIFPGIATWAADVLGVQSPANLIFLVMIFLMIWKMFALTNKLSMLETKLRQLAQSYAIREKEEDENRAQAGR